MNDAHLNILSLKLFSIHLAIILRKHIPIHFLCVYTMKNINYYYISMDLIDLEKMQKPQCKH